MKSHGIVELPKRRGGFDAFVNFITNQQLSGKAAGSIFKRLRRFNSGRPLTPDSLDRRSDNELRLAGLSAAKVESVRDLIRKVQNRELRVDRLSKMSDDEFTEAVTMVKGIGPWSAQMYLMFVLNRPDIFPARDLGIRNSVRRLYGIEATFEELTALSQPWRPFRSYAAYYLWRSLDNN